VERNLTRLRLYGNDLYIPLKAATALHYSERSAETLCCKGFQPICFSRQALTKQVKLSVALAIIELQRIGSNVYLL
jgi:hypothetical protein